MTQPPVLLIEWYQCQTTYSSKQVELWLSKIGLKSSQKTQRIVSTLAWSAYSHRTSSAALLTAKVDKSLNQLFTAHPCWHKVLKPREDEIRTVFLKRYCIIFTRTVGKHVVKKMRPFPSSANLQNQQQNICYCSSQINFCPRTFLEQTRCWGFLPEDIRVFKMNNTTSLPFILCVWVALYPMFMHWNYNY